MAKDTEDKNQKDDLSQLTIGKPESDPAADENLFALSSDSGSDSGKAIEGFTGLITPEPMPTGEEPIALDESTPDDPLANLPPIDQEILTTATGGNTEEFNDHQPMAPSLGADLGDAQDEPSADLPISDPSPEPSSESPDEALSPAVQAIEAGLEEIKKFSDHVAPTPVHVPANIPYSLLIEGRLQTHEKERLTSIVTKELGIREVELEPQFQAGKILIPRISEYAGVLLIQALRGAHVKMKLGPSDRIFTSKDPVTDEALIHTKEPDFFSTTESDRHQADLIPITPQASLGDRKLEILDTVHASINIKAAWVQSSNPSFFQDALEAVKRQLKFKAHHKGGSVILNFQTQVLPISDQTQYKLIVQGTIAR